MNRDHQNSKGRSGAAPPTQKRETVANNISGRVKHDDRGNAIWEWAVSSGKVANGAAKQRINKLDIASLSLAEEAPAAGNTRRSVKENPLGTVKGYSPYDSGLLSKNKAPRKKKDLRKLSEWMKLKKQAARNKAGK